MEWEQYDGSSGSGMMGAVVWMQWDGSGGIRAVIFKWLER